MSLRQILAEALYEKDHAEQRGALIEQRKADPNSAAMSPVTEALSYFAKWPAAQEAQKRDYLAKADAVLSQDKPAARDRDDLIKVVAEIMAAERPQSVLADWHLFVPAAAAVIEYLATQNTRDADHG